MKSLGDCGKFFIVTELVDGKLYHFDLDWIKYTEQVSELDKQRCLALSDYLVEIHKVKERHLGFMLDAPENLLDTVNVLWVC
jgi:hypothetical protein